jgi:hypothetical protein
MKSFGISAGVWLLAVCGTTALAEVSFTDSTFDDTNWTLTVFTQNAGGSLTASQQNTGGNPGQCMHIINSVPVGGGDLGFLARAGAIYDPGSQGAIEAIHYSEHAIMFTEFLNGMRTGPALFQGGKVFVYDVLRTPETNWTQKAAFNLVASNFAHVDAAFPSLEDTSTHPDFSATAPPMQFGFFRANGNPGVRDGGIDNWTVQVIQASPYLTHMRMEAGLAHFELVGATGHTYRVEFTPTFPTTNWIPLANIVLATSPFALTDTNAGVAGSRYYRAVRLP